MADKLMYIPDDATQNCPFCRLQLVVETCGPSTNQPKFNKISQELKETSPMSPPYLSSTLSFQKQSYCINQSAKNKVSLSSDLNNSPSFSYQTRIYQFIFISYHMSSKTRLFFFCVFVSFSNHAMSEMIYNFLEKNVNFISFLCQEKIS